jgi:hypothetical protein
MDWRTAIIREPPQPLATEDTIAYAAGWTLSGLATLGTIIAVWIFAI